MASILYFFKWRRALKFPELLRSLLASFLWFVAPNWKSMQGNWATPLTSAPESQGDSTESLEDPAKRAMITPDRIMKLTNTLMDERMMNDYGLILDCTPKGGFRNGSSSHFMELATCCNGLKTSKKLQCLHGVKLGTEGLKGWVLAVDNLDKNEQERQQHEQALGRP